MISKWGIFITICGMIAFTFISCQLFGLAGLIVGPLICLYASRPAKGSNKWVWHKH